MTSNDIRSTDAPASADQTSDRSSDLSHARRKALVGVTRITLAGALAVTLSGVALAQAVPLASAAPTQATAGSDSGFVDLRAAMIAAEASRDAWRASLDEIPNVTVQVTADGATQAVETNAATVAEALNDAGVVVDEDDIVSVPMGDPVTDGEAITVQRVDVTQVSEEVIDTHTSSEVESADMYVDESEVTTQGVDGRSVVTYDVVTIDGVESSRSEAGSVTTSTRVDEVVTVGTTERPVVAAAPATTTTTTTDSSSSSTSTSTPTTTTTTTAPTTTTSGDPVAIGQSMAASRGWTGSEWQCLYSLWMRESGWRTTAANPSGAYGIPQALPGSKMGSYGSDWATNPATQIAWGLDYIAGRYGSPCGAWSHSESVGWY